MLGGGPKMSLFEYVSLRCDSNHTDEFAEKGGQDWGEECSLSCLEGLDVVSESCNARFNFGCLQLVPRSE